MLASLLKRFKEVIIGDRDAEVVYDDSNDSDSEVEEEDDKKIVIPAVASRITGRDLEKSEEKNEDFDENKDTTKRLQGTGEITIVDYDTSTLVIDRTYRVGFAKLSILSSIKRGATVDYEISKAPNLLKWEAISLKVHEMKENPEQQENCRQVDVTAQVLQTEEGLIYIKIETNSNVITIENTPQVNVGFPWLPGDLMKLRIDLKKLSCEISGEELDEIPLDSIVSIGPAARKTVVGKVAHLDAHFLIDDSILLLKKLWKPNMVVGTPVKCEAISSNTELITGNSNQVKWRAISVQKSKFLHYIPPEINANYEHAGEMDEVGREAIILHHELMEDKCGIKILPEYVNFGSVFLGASKAKNFTVLNLSNNTHNLESIHYQQDPFVCKMDIQPSGNIVFSPKSKVVFEIKCKPLMVGKTTEMFVFNFVDFEIARNVSVIGRSVEEEVLDTREDSDAPKFRKQIGERDLLKIMTDRDRKRIRGGQSVRAPFFAQMRIPLNKVPNELYNIVKDQDDKRLKALYPRVLDVLNFEKYKEKFQVSLWFEEIEHDLRRRQYDVEGVHLQKSGTNPVYYTFQCPGIQEFYPPVNIKDTIDVFDEESEKNAKFQGTVTRVNGNTVVCVFGDAFDQQYTGFPLTVQFNLGRTNYKRCHFAVQTAIQYLGESFLFPGENITVKPPRMLIFEDGVSQPDEGLQAKLTAKKTSKRPSSLFTIPSSFEIGEPKGMIKSDGSSSAEAEAASPEQVGLRVASIRSRFVSDTRSAPSSSCANLKWFNPKLNQEQKDAVRRILRGQARPLPYIIYGPPGTGKTVTIVEAIMQLNHLDLNSRVLVCAPSNASADIIAEYLAKSGKYKPRDFVRLNGYHRCEQAALIPDYIIPFCNKADDLSEVVAYRIIVCTCMTTGQFFPLNLSMGHFTHVFIDEAGYCTEPEAMIPSILLALSKGGQLILAGDPNQLGPVLMSDVSKNVGLNISFLERLMDRKLYSRDVEHFPKEKYNPLVLTKLVKNYRSHEILLQLPSTLFYDGELEFMGDVDEVNSLCNSDNHFLRDILVQEGIPLVFHGVQGFAKRKKDTSSWSNTQEAIFVAKYVATLLCDCNLCAEDIGVITPYRKQVEKIRSCLQNNHEVRNLPKIGSVEEFQGGERKVMIISTVRADHDDQKTSKLERLEFLFQAKRFNVSITRAKYLMIVVGNPIVHSKSPYWGKLLQRALQLNVYRGCNLPKCLDPRLRTRVIAKKEWPRPSSSKDVGEEQKKNECILDEADPVIDSDDEFYDFENL